MEQFVGSGRFAPSPSGPLHLGNLRTALLAWLCARSTARPFRLRIDDLDTERAQHADVQIAELAEFGLTFDGPIVYQHDRVTRYEAVFELLQSRGLLYECFCTRKEIRDATRAPNGGPYHPANLLLPPGTYPGTCRHLTADERATRRRARRPAWRLRVPPNTVLTVHDELLGELTGVVDDMVIRRRDGAFAYNLAVVLDDHDTNVDQVVRGDDLATSAPRQAYLYDLLALPRPHWIHVPLAVNNAGQRLQKRDGAITLEALAAQGQSTAEIFALIAKSIGLRGTDPDTILPGFDIAMIPRDPWNIEQT